MGEAREKTIVTSYEVVGIVDGNEERQSYETLDEAVNAARMMEARGGKDVVVWRFMPVVVTTSDAAGRR